MIGKVVLWGDDYGIEVAHRDLEKAGLRVGMEVVVEVRAKPGDRIDLSRLRTFRMSGDLSVRHDDADWR